MITLSHSGRIGRDADACGAQSAETTINAASVSLDTRTVAKLAERLLEGSGGQRLEREVEHVAMGA
jgi:hypothetical protein